MEGHNGHMVETPERLLLRDKQWLTLLAADRISIISSTGANVNFRAVDLLLGRGVPKLKKGASPTTDFVCVRWQAKRILEYGREVIAWFIEYGRENS